VAAGLSKHATVPKTAEIATTRSSPRVAFVQRSWTRFNDGIWPLGFEWCVGRAPNMEAARSLRN
jgi:hypothetical protein